MTENPPRRRRWIVVTASVVGGLVVLGVAAELLLRGVIDDRIESSTADLPSGVSVTRDDTPALWQMATGRATLHVDVTPDALTDTARAATDLRTLEVTPRSDGLVAQVPLSVAGNEQTVEVLLSVAAEGGRAVLRADTVQFAGLSLPVATVAEQLGIDQLEQLADGVEFPEDESQITISSVRTTEDGLELGAELTMW